MMTPLLLALLVAPPAQAATAPQAPAAAAQSAADQIEIIEIRGNRNVRSDTILRNMRTKRGDRLNPETITRDIRALYALGWFDDIYVEEEPGSNGGKNLIFHFKERPNVPASEQKVRQ